jgi:hypothetical protein
MPIHDWTRVDAGIFHAFHIYWVTQIGRALNDGLLPGDYYALSGQVADEVEPDFIAAEQPEDGRRAPSEATAYVDNAVVVRHVRDHRVVAVVEIVAPWNNNTGHGLRAFVGKALELLGGGIHLLILDLFPPGPRDPQGIHKAIWDECSDAEFVLPPDRPLTLAAYIGGPVREAFVEAVAVGAPLPDMPLFLTPEFYVPVPLETTYRAAFDGLPAYWRDVLERPQPAP